MKKFNFGYVSKFYIGGIVLSLLLIAVPILFIQYINDTVGPLLFVAGAFLLGGTFSLTPNILHRIMKKKALKLEEGLKYDYKFIAHNAVFYIDADGRFGVVWRCNPFELQFANLAGLTGIRTHDGKMLGGTSLVSCRFQLDGKPYRIDTLRVYRGVLAMNSDQVIDAIAEADNLCELLNTAKNAAAGVTN